MFGRSGLGPKIAKSCCVTTIEGIHIRQATNYLSSYGVNLWHLHSVTYIAIINLSNWFLLFFQGRTVWKNIERQLLPFRIHLLNFSSIFLLICFRRNLSSIDDTKQRRFNPVDQYYKTFLLQIRDL